MVTLQAWPHCWPEPAAKHPLTPGQIEAKAHALLAEMSLDERIAQMPGGASRFPGLITVWISYERRPVPTADNQRLGIPDLRNMFAEYTADYGGVMAAAVLSILPILLVFIFLQRYFIEGITMSGIKG